MKRTLSQISLKSEGLALKRIFTLAVAAMLAFAAIAYAGSFTDNGNGTVTDNVTGLMWQQEDDNGKRKWQAALDYCNSLTFAGHTDWRLPSKDELASLVDKSQGNPPINLRFFPGTYASYYWSSTAGAGNPSGAWAVDFGFGDVNLGDKTSYSLYVRCVR